MNPNWKNFLLSEQAGFETDFQISFLADTEQNYQRIYPVAHLTVLTVSGRDAAAFLQGQITCNVHGISETQSSLGALCNPKGRAIATFLLIKTGNAFLMVLPVELVETVKNRLIRYILRSNVVLTESCDELCLVGLSSATESPADDGIPSVPSVPSVPSGAQGAQGAQGATPPLKGGLWTGAVAEMLFSTTQQETIAVNLGTRKLIVAPSNLAISLWKEMVCLGYQPTNSAHWRYLDIISGLPWLTTETSEAFIPQMLNLDKLGGISFNKGCYTGQEVVARTHYLGKAKRAMFLAECNTPDTPDPNSIIIDDSLVDALTETDQTAGRVLLAEHDGTTCKMLIVIPVSDTGTYQLRLANQHKLTLLTGPNSRLG
ncbi:MAG: folate-binding protein [Methylovulum sp.]|nr:folate-binding protein [Methylovulum sp.]